MTPPRLPDDFGLSPVETLSRVGDPTPAVDHSPYWNKWLKAVRAEPRPILERREAGGTGASQPDASDPSATHGFLSVGGVRIGARLLLPPRGTPIRGGVVSTHGYAVAKPLAERDRAFAGPLERGVAVLNIRLRGFAGSRLDCGDLTRGPERGLGWVCHGLDADEDHAQAFGEWVYVQAVGDVFNACRAMRWWLNERAGPLSKLHLHGESFGGGLAVAAGALITGRPEAITNLDRLVLALPSMGDWPWRLSHPPADADATPGMGAEISRLIARRPGIADLIIGRLRVTDSVVLAAKVRCPVLCKLAERDEVVPAPTAAAVFNALGVDPGRKWRFIVPHGHTETGIANARRHAEFERAMTDFICPDKTPEGAMAEWEPRMRQRPGEATPAEPDAMLFGEAQGTGQTRVGLGRQAQS